MAKKKEGGKESAASPAKKKKTVSAADSVSAKDFSGEIGEPRWSVVSFETIAARSLTYAEAAKKLKQLEAEKVSGLCIVTDEAAARISK